MSHKQAKRLRRAQREATGSCELDRKREVSRLRYAKIDQQRQALEKLKREDPAAYRKLLEEDRAKLRKTVSNMLASMSAIGIVR